MNVIQVLQRLRIEVTSQNHEHAEALCPDHQDTKPSWRIRLHGERAGLHHCFGAGTMVLTSRGAYPIERLAGTTARLLTMNGQGRGVWVDAPIRSFGEQTLWEIVLRRNGVRKTIRVTTEHRWFVNSQGSKWMEKTTCQLKVGQRLRSVTPARSGTIKPSPWGVAHGFTYGDGTLTQTGARVTLWGTKDAALREFFPFKEGRSVETPNGVRGIEIDGLPRSFKEFPPLDESASYLYGWLAGYFAADGSVDISGMPTLPSANRAALEYVEKVCLRLGVVTYGISSFRRKGFGEVDSAIYTLSFRRSTLTEGFFLAAQHRDRWLKSKATFERVCWRVEKVIRGDVEEEVFCAVVPETHCFALEGFILTGNCQACKWGGDLADLVQHVRGYATKTAAYDWLEEHGAKVEREDLVAPALELTTGQRQRAAFRMPRGFEAGPLSTWPTVPREYALSRGLDARQVATWGIGYAAEGRLNGRLVIPVVSRQGVLSGYMARAWDKAARRRYLYPHESEGADLDAVFGEQRWVRGTTCIVTEGALKSLAVERVFPAWSHAALGGSGVRPMQLAKMAAAGFASVVVMTDGDEAGDRVGTELRTQLKRYVYTTRCRLPPGQDADSIGPERLRAALSPYLA